MEMHFKLSNNILKTVLIYQVRISDEVNDYSSAVIHAFEINSLVLVF